MQNVNLEIAKPSRRRSKTEVSPPVAEVPVAEVPVAEVPVADKLESAPVNSAPMSADDPAAHLAYKSAFELDTARGRLVFKASRMRECLVNAGYDKKDARVIVDSFILRHRAVISVKLSCDTQGRIIKTVRQYTGDVSEEVRAHNEEAAKKRKALQMVAIKAGAPRMLSYRDDLVAGK